MTRSGHLSSPHQPRPHLLRVAHPVRNFSDALYLLLFATERTLVELKCLISPVGMRCPN